MKFYFLTVIVEFPIHNVQHNSKSILQSINQINYNYKNKNIKYSSLLELINPKGYN